MISQEDKGISLCIGGFVTSLEDKGISLYTQWYDNGDNPGLRERGTLLSTGTRHTGKRAGISAFCNRYVNWVVGLFQWRPGIGVMPRFMQQTPHLLGCL